MLFETSGLNDLHKERALVLTSSCNTRLPILGADANEAQRLYAPTRRKGHVVPSHLDLIVPDEAKQDMGGYWSGLQYLGQ